MDIGKALLSVAKAFAPKADLVQLEQVITELPTKIPAFMDGVDAAVKSIETTLITMNQTIESQRDEIGLLRTELQELRECLKLRQSPPSPLSPPESKPKPNGRKI